MSASIWVVIKGTSHRKHFQLAKPRLSRSWPTYVNLLRGIGHLSINHRRELVRRHHRHISAPLLPSVSLLISPYRNMSASPKNRITNGNGNVHPVAASGVIIPVSQMLGNKLRTFAKSRLPVPNRPKTRTQQTRRVVMAAAPVPFAPIIDRHAFQPPPPYSARPDESESAEFLVVPNNTPEASPLQIQGVGLSRDETVKDSTGAAQSARTPGEPGPSGIKGRASGSGGHLVGLGLGGLEKGDGGQFDGLGRLSGGFRPSSSGTDVDEAADTSRELREEVQKKLFEHSKRQRDRASIHPKKRHDIFYASLSGEENRNGSTKKTVRVMRRQSTASPTPPSRVRRPLSQLNRDLSRGTISTEMKRAASLERRASLSLAKEGLSWRM
ncbi:hypothetical protein F5I97DRAFT_979772 [Phlebopus sp. FC_14]|nr:hypothetical protein F5I97DRAFT_469148 [Phlebopus sp. FC_14]KAH7888283.1 hypothetical protein F5I97DRAFT_979772 [Phlebopus sp. FC_14]